MAAHQAPPSLGFSRQEYWSGLPFPSPMHESEKWKWSCSVVSDPQQPHGLQPTRLLHPWDVPGKSTGVGCHCLLRNWLIALLKLCLWSMDTENPHASQHWARCWGSTDTQGSIPAPCYSWEGHGTSILRNTHMWHVLGESSKISQRWRQHGFLGGLYR